VDDPDVQVVAAEFSEMNILVFTSLWPNAEQPSFALFVKHRVAAMSRLERVNVRVVAPVPYFPEKIRLPILDRFWPGHWRKMARIPRRELVAGIETFHPRHLVTPKIGMTFYGRWMADGVESLARRLCDEQPVDVIDAHYVYPDGYAATLIGERLKIPVVITARGTDVNLFSRMPLIRPLVRKALMRADGVIAVSDALKRRMVELGVESEKIATIRNGVDRAVFYPRDRMEARRKLGLDPKSRVIVTASALVPLKGIDRLVDAMALLRDVSAKLYVIGEGTERAALETRIARHGLADRVLLVGSRPQSELAEWHSAADLFCLASHREGCPNVVIEAMACGLPVVAADVGGVGELVSKPDYGRVVSAPTAENFAAEIEAALGGKWDRDEIAKSGCARSWSEVAEEVMSHYLRRGIINQTIETRKE
jgi:glycosyltransferase involved in cell wall biosynthesis